LKARIIAGRIACHKHLRFSAALLARIAAFVFINSKSCPTIALKPRQPHHIMLMNFDHLSSKEALWIYEVKAPKSIRYRPPIFFTQAAAMGCLE
jgi:hypothetical protein